MISHSFTTRLAHQPRKIYSLFKIEYTCFSVFVLSDHEILFQNITKNSIWQIGIQNYNDIFCKIRGVKTKEKQVII